MSSLPGWRRRLGDYGLALLWVGVAALVRWALWDVLSPTPFLVFYLAWVGAAAFGGLGPGLLATLASWLCVELLFDYTPGHIGFSDPISVTRLLVFLAGGLVVSAVGEAMRRSRIRERRQTEKLADAHAALRGSEEKYRFLVENSKDITWTIDLQGRWTFVSSNVEKVAGYRAEEVIGKTLWDFLAPECHDRVRERLRRRARGEDLPPYEVLMVDKEGRRIPFEVVTASIVGEDGKIVGVQGVSRDITERKRAEQELKESRDRYQALIETTADFIWEMDAEGKYTYCSPQMKDLWGYEPQDMIGKTPFEVMPREERERALASFRSMAKSPQPITGLEMSSYDSQGHLITVEVSGVPFFDAEGRLLGYRGISRDVTERRRAQEELAESRKKYRGLVERVNDWVWEIDADGVYTYASPRVRDLLGYAPEEIVGKTPFDFMPPTEAQRVWDVFEPTWLARKPLKQLENTLVRKDGRLVVVETSGMPVFADDGSFGGYTGIDRDVTERKRAEEALRQEKTFADRLLNAPRDTVFLFEPTTGKPIRWNERFAEVSGYDDEEIAGMKAPDDFYDEDDLAKAREATARVFAEGQGVVELSLVTKRGRHIPFEYTATVVEAEDGKTLFLSIGRDITERKQAEEALRESRERLERAQEIAHLGSWELDLVSNRLTWSDEVYRIFGLQPQEFGATYEAFLDRVHPEDRAAVDAAYSGSLREGRDTYEIEHRVVRKSTGEIRIVHEKCEHVRDASARVIRSIGMVHDITERKQAERELRELNATLESRVAQRTAQLQRRAGQLQKLTLELTEAEERERKRLAGILHDDLQQVLAAARFQAGLLSSRVRDNAESHEIAEQTKDLLGDAIAKSRDLSHELSAPGLSRSNLSEAFEWLTEQMQQKHRFTVHLKIGEQIEVASEPLRVLLFKAAQELLFNVTKHAGVSEATLRLRRQRGRLRLSVSDKGRGFESGPSGPALGFGLLSIRERVEYLGGRMKIHSTPGKGSIFIVTVPDAEASP